MEELVAERGRRRRKRLRLRLGERRRLDGEFGRERCQRSWF